MSHEAKFLSYFQFSEPLERGERDREKAERG